MEFYTKCLLFAWMCTLVAGVVIAILHLSRDKARGMLALAMAVLVPVLGLPLALILTVRFREGHYAMSATETIRKTKIKESAYVDEERAMNAVPSVDALNISGNRERRAYLLGLLRQNELESLRDVFRQALRNSDSEASHYAASALMELQRQSYNAMVEAAVAFEAAPGDYQTARSYANLMFEYMANAEAGNVENAELQARYEEVLLHILGSMEDDYDPTDFEALVRHYLRRGHPEKAWEWASSYAAVYPTDELGYLLMMEAAYQAMRPDDFAVALGRLRDRRDIVLTREGLAAVRFWMDSAARPAQPTAEGAAPSATPIPGEAAAAFEAVEALAAAGFGPAAPGEPPAGGEVAG